MTTEVLCKYIESLRKMRKIELEDFTKEIVSVRQYKRYLSGDSEMPYRVLNLLSERLGFNPVKIQGFILDEESKQNEIIEKLFNLTVAHQFDEFDKYKKENPLGEFFSKELEMYYQTAMLMQDYYRYEKPKEECNKELKDIIDYKNAIKKDLFEPTELLVLSILLMFLDESEKDELLEKLSNQLMKDKVTLGNDFYSRQYITLRIAREYGLRKQDEKVIELCLKALELSERAKIHFNYDFFYYYLALSHRNLKDDENKKKYAKKLYRYLLFIDDEVKTKKYVSRFEKDFDFTIEELR